MADRWWVNDDADGDWNNANNWSTTEGGAGGAGVPTSSDNALFSDTSSSDDCTLSANSVCGNLYTGSADTGGTDNYSGTIDISTYNLTNSGATKIANGATLKIGVSADTGLTTAGLTYDTGATADYQTTSKINNSGNYYCHNSTVFVADNTGDYTQTGDGMFDSRNGANDHYNITINSGVTLTPTANTRVSSGNSNNFTNNGIIACGANLVLIGCRGVITFGVNSDFTGSNKIGCYFDKNAVLINNKSGAFSFTGTLKGVFGVGVRSYLTGDWSNADVELRGGTYDMEWVAMAGTLKCKNFTILNNNNFSVTVTNSTNNPTFDISGDIDLNAGTGTYTTTWTKGTGTITLTGGDADIDFANKTVEDILINATGTKTFTEDVKPDSLSTVAGTVDFNGKTYTMSESLTLGQNCTITGLEGSTFIVDGNFTASGAGVGSELDLTAASEWILTVSGNGSAQYVNVSYSNASGGSTIHAIDSVDGGNTQNWDFTPAPVTPQGLRAIHRRPLPQLAIFSDGLW